MVMDIQHLEGLNGIYFPDHYYNKKDEEILSIRKGPWSCEEDSILINYIAIYGQQHWNHVARNSGLKRTGKSCRMRWKNYLNPNVRRGNFTKHEQLRIIQLHSLFGNRWSKIAEFLPGRTDNEIKNYWRTRVQKQAKQLNYDINSKEFRDFTRQIWLPSLCQQIYASKSSNNLEDVVKKIDSVEITLPEQIIQMDNNWTTSLSSTLSVTHDNHHCSRQNCNLIGCAFQKIDDPTPFTTSGELSDMLLGIKY